MSIDVDKLLTTSFRWDNRITILALLPHKCQVQFAVFCAEQVTHLLNEQTKKLAFKAIDTTKLWLEDKATSKECSAAANAAHDAYDDAYDATYAANATYDTVYNAANATYNAAAYTATSAADTAAYASNAAAHAAYAAFAAASAAYNAANTDIKSEQITYLRILIQNNLSKEDKDNWLLIACI